MSYDEIDHFLSVPFSSNPSRTLYRFYVGYVYILRLQNKASHSIFNEHSFFVYILVLY